MYEAYLIDENHIFQSLFALNLMNTLNISSIVYSNFRS